MGRSQETYNKKEVKNKKDKKRKEKEEKRLARRDAPKMNSFDDMIAYVDENGMISSTPPDESKKMKIELQNIEISVPKSENIPVDLTRKGKVSYYNSSKGYGFIRDSDTHESIFVFVKNALDPIEEGNLVSYEMGKGPKGPIAMNVKLIR